MNIKIWLLILLLCFGNRIHAQQQNKNVELRGKVFNAINDVPIQNALITINGSSTIVETDADGSFVLSLPAGRKQLVITAPDFYTKEVFTNKKEVLRIGLIPQSEKSYFGDYNLPFSSVREEKRTGSATLVNVPLQNRALVSADEMLVGNMAGVRAIQKGGMSGEGYQVMVRGIRSLSGGNAPIVMVDGVPILPDWNPSYVFTGYSNNVLRNIGRKEISNISVVKGYDAAELGSFGSNGVIIIKTDQPADMETKVEFETVNGVEMLSKELSLLDATDFKNYLYRIGQTQMTGKELYSTFPFLQENPKLGEAYYAYQHNTNWQREVFKPAFSTDNILKVKGGDAIAKYSLMAGYSQISGIEVGTKMSRYYARFNANMRLTKKLEMYTNIGFNFFDNGISEQGMQKEVNPMLAAIRKPAVLGPLRVNRYNKQLEVLDPVRQFQVSNPRALVEMVEGSSALYNTMVNFGLNYSFNPYFLLKTVLGIDYNYTREKLFIPGVSTNTIMPLDNGLAKNMVRNAAGKNMSYYGNVSANYKRNFNNIHDLGLSVGTQMLWNDKLYEYAKGINTATDYNKSLSNVKDAFGKHMEGYDERWKWFNFYGKLSYNYKQAIYAGATIAADASSITGVNTDIFSYYPAFNVAWKINNTGFLRGLSAIDNLTVRGEYSTKGNIQFSSMLAHYHYVVSTYKEMGGLVRGNIPNKDLRPEQVYSTNIGLDFACFNRRFDITLNAYNDITKKMLLPEDLPSAFGSKFRYVNSGEMETKGLELSMNIQLVRSSNWSWSVGMNVAHDESKIKNLGGRNEIVQTLTDGAQIISRVGESPYLFYGLKTDGVYTTSNDAAQLGLTDYRGLAYSGGDLIYRNMNDDKVIDSDDFMVIGDPNPDFYGGFSTSLRYRNVSLSALFTYAYGNQLYNAVRRVGESMNDVSSQTSAVNNSWNYEGHVTNIPKATLSDKMNNGQYSSRWIEDGSYLKLKDLTINYDYNKKVWFLRNLQIYLSGTNLLTFTKYLGYDPEFAWSYDRRMQGVDYGKVPGARTFKVGIRLGI